MNHDFYCIRFYVTFRCNSRCAYCNVWRDEKFRGVAELPLEQAKELLRQAWKVGGRYIDFTGGEPTLYPHLAELVRYARELGFKTEVTTNAVMGGANLFRIAEAADKFNVSLDTLNPEVYQNRRGIDMYDQVLQHLQMLQSVRSPKLMTVVTQENLGELDDLSEFARNHHALLYLNPMFSYFNHQNADITNCINSITRRIFQRNTVVMLHFLEFITHSRDPERPACSANRHTLTFAPDGSLMLPCYHAVKEGIRWDGNLQKMLASETFQSYWNRGCHLDACKSCNVVPYFGISFNYKLNRYFLLQSFSEKLNHLKRDYLNELPDLECQQDHLLTLLEELVNTVRMLRLPALCNGLYSAVKTENGWESPVYRMPIPDAIYRQEQKCTDCWSLKLVPHYGYDRIVNACFPDLLRAYWAGDRTVSAYAFRHAMEFQLRYWLWYIQRFLRVESENWQEHEDWLRNYCEVIGYCFNEAVIEEQVKDRFFPFE